jgi:TetR/AcrR family transcriptional regulator
MIRSAGEVDIKRSRGRPACDAPVGSDTLLRSARRTFAKRGFDASSVREIARDAGVDAALVAHHFGCKEALWVAVVERIALNTHGLIKETADLRTSALGARKRVEKALSLFVDQVFAEPDIGMFFSTAATEEGERLDKLVELLLRPYHDVLVPLIVDAIAAKQLPDNDPDVVFSMMTAAISKTVAYRHLVSIFSPTPEDPVRFKGAVLATALAMLG